MAGAQVLERAGIRRRAGAERCCGRPLISQGLLDERAAPGRVEHGAAVSARRARAAARVLRAQLPLGDSRRRAGAAARRRSSGRRGASPTRAMLFEEFLEQRMPGRARAARPRGRVRRRSCCTGTVIRRRWACWRRPRRCSRGSPARRSSISTPAAAAWPDRSATRASTSRSRARSASAGCCRPRASLDAGAVLVASGVSCRHQVADFTGVARAPPGRAAALAVSAEACMNLAVISVCRARRSPCSSAASAGSTSACSPIALAWIVGVYIGGMPVNTVMGGFPTPAVPDAGRRDAAVLAGAVQRHARPARPPRGARLPRQPRRRSRSCSSCSAPRSRRWARATSPPRRCSRRWRWRRPSRAGIPLFLMAIMVGNGANAGSLSPFAPTGIIVNGLMARNGLPGLRAADLPLQPARARAGRVRRLLPVRRPEAVRGERAPVVAARRQRCDGRRRRDGRTTRSSAATGSRSASIAALILSVIVREGQRRHGRVRRRRRPRADAVGRRRRGDQADAVAGDRDGLRRDGADRAPREGAGHRPARVARRQVLDRRTPSPASSRCSPGIVSVYSSTSGVVLPAFLPMVPGLAAALPRRRARSPSPTSMNIGGHLVDVSPLSTIGALCLAGAPADESRAAVQQAARLGAVDGGRGRDLVLCDLLTQSSHSAGCGSEETGAQRLVCEPGVSPEYSSSIARSSETRESAESASRCVIRVFVFVTRDRCRLDHCAGDRRCTPTARRSPRHSDAPALRTRSGALFTTSPATC